MRSDTALLLGSMLLAVGAWHDARADQLVGQFLQFATLNGVNQDFLPASFGSADLPQTAPNSFTDTVDTATMDGSVAIVNPSQLFAYPQLGVSASVSGTEAGSAQSMVTLQDTLDVTGNFVGEASKLLLIFGLSANVIGNANASLSVTGATSSFPGEVQQPNTFVQLTDQGTSHGTDPIIFDIPVEFAAPHIYVSFSMSENAFASIPESLASDMSAVDALDPASLQGYRMLDVHGNSLSGYTVTTSGGVAVPQAAPEPATFALGATAAASLLLAARRHRMVQRVA